MKPALLSRGLIPFVAYIMFPSLAVADAGVSIILRHTERARVVDYQYTANATTARLERLGEPTIPPSPWNLIDRATGAITILRPHNQSITILHSDAFERRQHVTSDPARQPGITSPPGIGANPITQNIGPDPALLPEGVELPELPAISQSAPSIPGGISGGIPGSMPSLGFGDIPGMAPTNPELTAHEETRTLHGHKCQRHTLSLDRNLELELWLAESPDLPPFYLLLWDGPPHFGHNEILQDWPHLIRKTGKFPLLATLREVERQTGFPVDEIPEPTTPALAASELARWEVISIEHTTPDDKLFIHPANFFKIDD